MSHLQNAIIPVHSDCFIKIYEAGDLKGIVSLWLITDKAKSFAGKVFITSEDGDMLIAGTMDKENMFREWVKKHSLSCETFIIADAGSNLQTTGI